jgi:hypothetical protein
MTNTITRQMLRKWGTLRSSQVRALIPPDGITPLQLCDDTRISATDRVQILLRPEVLPADACARIARLAADRAQAYAAAAAKSGYDATYAADYAADYAIRAAANAATYASRAANAAANAAYAATYGGGSAERELQLADIRAELTRLEMP